MFYGFLGELWQVGYDPGFHVVNAMKKVPLPYRWAWELRLSSVHGGGDWRHA